MPSSEESLFNHFRRTQILKSIKDMAAFASSSSSQHQVDSSAYTTINKMCSSLDQSSGVVVSDHQYITKVSYHGVCNEASAYYSVTANNKNSVDSSSMVTDNNLHKYFDVRITPEKDTQMVKKSPNCLQFKEQKQKKVKAGEEIKKKSKDEKKAVGYIHVRARRGQATDSHSLAERVRREKISERMKLLQALVPGCQKVTGKALMLDEIINYVRSLQNQVEFLSMKLAYVNPMSYDFGMDFESVMIRPDQDLNSLPSTLPTSIQTCSPTLTANHYPIFMDNSANSLLLQYDHIPNALPDQGHRQVLWETDDQTHKIMNQNSIFPTSF